MSRFFDGQFSTESVSFSAGNATFDQGPITIAALIKPVSSFASATCFVVVGQNSGTDVWAVLTDTAKPFMVNDFSGGSTLTAGNWYWVVVTKASGSVQPRWHIRNVTTAGAWSHTSGAGNVADNTGPVNGIIAGNNSASGGNDWRGNVAALAVWGSALADLSVEAACTLSAADLATATPAWGTLWNQASTATAVTDFSGGGGNQTAISGTSVDVDEPPGWSYTLTGASPSVAVATPPLPPHLLYRLAARNQRQWQTGPQTGGPVALDGAGPAASSALADLAVDRPLTATGSAASSGTANASVDRPLTASGPAAASATATTVVARGLTATAPAAASATGTATVTRPLTATAAAAATGTATATVARPLTGTASGAVSATADLSIQGQVSLTATASAAASAASTLTRTAGLAGTAPAAATATATATVARRLTGSAATAAGATADLAILAPYEPARTGVDSSGTAGTVDGRTSSGGVDHTTRGGTLDSSSRQPADHSGTSRSTQVDL